MADAQGLTRSQSMPVLKTEEAILKKIQDQDGIISLMQTQIEFQSELIAKHDKIFETLFSQVQDLSTKLKTLEESYSKGAESKEREAARSALWTTNSTTNGAVESKTSLADMVKETAEQAMGGTESGFVFDEKLGLYFDQSSGYYYDPIKQLYYNGHTKTFYSYDATTNTYQVHSTSTNSSKRKKKNSTKVSKKYQGLHKTLNSSTTDNVPPKSPPMQGELVDISSPIPLNTDDREIVEVSKNINEDNALSPAKSMSDMEEGEISSSAPTSAESSPRGTQKDSESCDESSEKEEDDTLHQNYPPCIRAVVQECSGAQDCKKGTLFLVPFTGGTIGSTGSHHAILIDSCSVENVPSTHLKNHAKIHYDYDQKEPSGEDPAVNNDQVGKYFITDLGSTHGTFLNRARLSESGQISEPQEIVHGSTLQVGDVVLLIHIHPGDFTCGHCEPGLILQKDPLYEYTNTANTGETARRSEIKKLKKKYGLDRKNANVPATDTIDANKYVDRAKSRRVKVGSDNPFAKTEVASTHTPIRESNKGFKMLQKMGWKGEGLGKSDNQGIKEPIKCEVKADRLGLGVENSSHLATSATSLGKSSKTQNKRMEQLAKTVERFKEAQVFKEDDL